MSLFTHDDYRGYLKAYLRALPKQGRGELTRIAAHLKVNTTLLSQIFAGTRDLNLEQALDLSEYLGHSELESEYFLLLIQFERAGSRNLKQHMSKKIEALKKDALKLAKRVEHQKSLSEADRAVFYSSWIYSAVHLFCSVKDKGVTADEIAERFQQSRPRTAEVLRFLTQAGLIVEENLKYKIGTQTTFIEQGSPHLLKHHANWRVRAIQKSESLSESEMIFTGQAALSEEDFAYIRDALAELIKTAASKSVKSKAVDVACLNIDWFWLEKPLKR